MIVHLLHRTRGGANDVSIYVLVDEKKICRSSITKRDTCVILYVLCNKKIKGNTRSKIDKKFQLTRPRRVRNNGKGLELIEQIQKMKSPGNRLY